MPNDVDIDRLSDKIAGQKVVSIDEARELARARASYMDKSLVDLPEVAGFKFSLLTVGILLVVLYVLFLRRR